MNNLKLPPAVARLVVRVAAGPALDPWPNGAPDKNLPSHYMVGVQTTKSSLALTYTADPSEARRLAADLADRLGVPLNDMTAGGA